MSGLHLFSTSILFNLGNDLGTVDTLCQLLISTDNNLRSTFLKCFFDVHDAMNFIHGSLGSLRVIEHFLPITLFHSLCRGILQLFFALDGEDAAIFLVLRMVFSLLR